MQKFWAFIFILFLPASALFSQRIELIPYPDAVPVSTNGIDKVFLSNTDSKILMEYFVAEYSPDKVIYVKEGYFSGYRLCFTDGSCSPEAESSDWIQVLTIDEDAALLWFKKNSPEILALPFEGLKDCVGKNGYRRSDYKEVVEKFRFLACRMYSNIIGPDGIDTDEMTANLQRVRLKTDSRAENLFASLSQGGLFYEKSQISRHAQADPWVEWIKCFEDLSSRGFISLIEFNEPAISPY